MNHSHLLSRREFIGVSAVALLFVRSGQAAESEIPRIGVCTSFKSAGIVKAGGASYVEESVGNFLMPARPDAEFRDQLKQAQAAGAALYSCNGFLPASLKAVGPAAAHDEIVKYAATAFERAEDAGIRIIVFGSGPSRRIPDGFPRQQAVTQMVELCRRLAEPAARHGVTVAIEPLNKAECNFLVRLDELIEIMTGVGHPALAITADLYHMACEGDGAAECERAAKWIRHVHIAEKAGRTPPGVKADDFTPWFRVLKQHQYAGCISIECKWTNMTAELPVAVETIRKQWRAAG